MAVPQRKSSPRRETRRPSGARAVALAALARVLEDSAPLEAALESAAGHAACDPRDRAFARLLAATVLRRLGEIEAVTARCVERPLPGRAGTARRILALGIAQILFLGTPAHAAVATAVELAGAAGAARHKGLINAVLRRVAREGRALLDGLDAPRIDAPDWLWDSWVEAYGAETARRMAAAHLAEPPLDLTLRDPATAERWAGALAATVLPTGSLRRAGRGAIPDLPGYAEGAWWVQDAAAALPARLFRAPAGARILDLCAAPGGKTLQLAAAGAAVTALDISPERLALLEANLARTGLAAELVAADGRSFAADRPFDGVLIDAPCSSTGTLRRHPDIARTKGPADLARLVPLQEALLANGAGLVRPGGTLIYAVCSLAPAEGEGRIEAFLATHPDFAPDPVAPAELGGLAELVAEAGALRTFPFHLGDRGGMDGFYAVRLRRSGEAAR